MPRFAANLTMLFTELPFLDRFERAAQAGFEAVEFQFPYEWDAREIRARLDHHGLQPAMHNMPPGDWAAGERGMACHPGRGEAFRASVRQAIDYANALGAGQLHCLAGIAPAGVPPELLHRTYIDNLRHAAAECKACGLRLLIEPINRHDIPGYWLSSSAQALRVLDELGADNAHLQYDVYHAQRSEGELAATLARHIHRIGHIQIADNPGRHEPGSGEINYSFLFAHLDRIGYRGWVGCEYAPENDTESGLAWRERLVG